MTGPGIGEWRLETSDPKPETKKPTTSRRLSPVARLGGGVLLCPWRGTGLYTRKATSRRAGFSAYPSVSHGVRRMLPIWHPHPGDDPPSHLRGRSGRRVVLRSGRNAGHRLGKNPQDNSILDPGRNGPGCGRSCERGGPALCFLHHPTRNSSRDSTGHPGHRLPRCLEHHTDGNRELGRVWRAAGGQRRATLKPGGCVAGCAGTSSCQQSGSAAEP